MKNKFWTNATYLVVFILILNPELISLAMFIDIVGVDTWLLLIEVQILAVLRGYTFSYITPLFLWLKPKLNKGDIINLVPSQATAMQSIVVIYAAGLLY